jgi:DNA-binding NarL/FixJ family response regulator
MMQEGDAMTTQIRVLLVDDQPAIRQGLRLRLTTEPDMAVVGEAADGAEALELAIVHGPDVVVLDIWMPGMDGFETARQLRQLRAGTRVAIVMLSLHDDAASRARALTAGADVFVAKHEADAQLVDAIRRVAAGVERRGQLTNGGP